MPSRANRTMPGILASADAALFPNRCEPGTNLVAMETLAAGVPAILAANTGQFERTLIIADAGSYVSYLEGCTAPVRDENQLHAAVVELVALDDATIKYSTVQNWYPGDKNGVGGIYNFVTKRGKELTNAKITWTQVETGSAITWK